MFGFCFLKRLYSVHIKTNVLISSFALSANWTRLKFHITLQQYKEVKHLNSGQSNGQMLFLPLYRKSIHTRTCIHTMCPSHSATTETITYWNSHWMKCALSTSIQLQWSYGEILERMKNTKQNDRVMLEWTYAAWHPHTHSYTHSWACSWYTGKKKSNEYTH